MEHMLILDEADLEEMKLHGLNLFVGKQVIHISVRNGGASGPNVIGEETQVGSETAGEKDLRLKKARRRRGRSGSKARSLAKRHSCPDCPMSFASTKWLENHQRRRHNKPTLPPETGPSTPSAPKRIYSCPNLCGATFPTKQAVGGHKGHCSGKKKPPTPNIASRVWNRNGTEGRWPCGVCVDIVFETKQELLDHQRDKHGVKIIYVAAANAKT